MPIDVAELLHKELYRLGVNFPAQVVQLSTSREDSERYLHQNPSLPFIIRNSSEQGYLALDFINAEGNVNRFQVKQSQDGSGFMVYATKNGTKIPVETLGNYAKILNQNAIARSPQPIEMQQQLNNSRQNQPIAVLSIQSLGAQKIALSAEEVQRRAATDRSLQNVGEGHTGFAMAKALHAPFVVIRSEGNDALANATLKNHVVNNGLIVVTGHGSIAGNTISGTYDDVTQADAFKEQTRRGYWDVANSVVAAGLKTGDHITIVLSICHAAKENKPGDSFAQKLAVELASKGISSTIIASDAPVMRFGLAALRGDKIEFSDTVGMAAENVHVFATQVQGPTNRARVEVSKPNANIQLSSEGINFAPTSKVQSPKESHIGIVDVDELLKSLPPTSARAATVIQTPIRPPIPPKPTLPNYQEQGAELVRVIPGISKAIVSDSDMGRAIRLEGKSSKQTSAVLTVLRELNVPHNSKMLNDGTVLIQVIDPGNGKESFMSPEYKNTFRNKVNEQVRTIENNQATTQNMRNALQDSRQAQKQPQPQQVLPISCKRS